MAQHIVLVTQDIFMQFFGQVSHMHPLLHIISSFSTIPMWSSYGHVTEIHFRKQLGSVAGPVIQANGRLSFEDDLRSALLCFTVNQLLH